MSMRHLRSLGNRIHIAIPTDADGFIGRKCPNTSCLGYFKVLLGTGLTGENLPCHCPYCGHTAAYDHFPTQEQLNYAQSVATKRFSEAIKRDVGDWDRRLRQQTRGSFIQLRMAYKDRIHPIAYYRERELETKVICDKCTLQYAIFGVFGYCPDCGSHNSEQILSKNLDLCAKQVALASREEDRDFADYLLGDALENAVASFDGFGRETCRVHAAKASDDTKAQVISFQNLEGARSRVSALFGFDLAACLDSTKWLTASQCFQKRHLLAHRMGVVDQTYLDATKDQQAIIGHKVIIQPAEVTELLANLRTLGRHLVEKLEQLS